MTQPVMPSAGRLTPAARNSSSITSCSTGARRSAPRLGPVRHHVPGLDQPVAAGLRRPARRSRRRRRAPRPRSSSASGGRSRLCSRVTPAAVSRMTSAAAAAAPNTARASVARRRYRCASCSQVKPMPPCTWMLSSRSCARRHGEGRPRPPRPASSWSRRDRPRPAPRPTPAAVAELGRHQHVGAVVLDRLERRDGAAELLAHLGVVDRGVHALGGPADGLGREQRAGVGQRIGRGAGQDVGARRHAVEHAPARSGGSGRGWPGISTVDAGAPSRSITQHVVAARYQQQVGQTRAEHHPGVTGGDPAGAPKPSRRARRPR